MHINLLFPLQLILEVKKDNLLQVSGIELRHEEISTLLVYS